MSGKELIPVGLREIQATESSGAQILILGEDDGDRQFPIFIGIAEMDALDRALHGKETARPLTHDLILNVIDSLGGQLSRVIVSDLQDDTFFAKVGVQMPDGSEELIDSRPSDAMVLAARRHAPIFVAVDVLDSIGKPPPEMDFE